MKQELRVLYQIIFKSMDRDEKRKETMQTQAKLAKNETRKVFNLPLNEVCPELVREIKDLLLKQDREDLARTVDGLYIYDRCRCGDAYCASLYMINPDDMLPPPKGSRREYVIVLQTPDNGYLVLDLRNGRIAAIEILDRDEYQKIVDEVFGTEVIRDGV